MVLGLAILSDHQGWDGYKTVLSLSSYHWHVSHVRRSHLVTGGHVTGHVTRGRHVIVKSRARAGQLSAVGGVMLHPSEIQIVVEVLWKWIGSKWTPNRRLFPLQVCYFTWNIFLICSFSCWCDASVMCGRCGGSGRSGGGGRTQDPSEKVFRYKWFVSSSNSLVTNKARIKVKWRKCDWVTFLTHDFTWQFLHHLQIRSCQLSENDFLIHLSTSIRFLQKSQTMVIKLRLWVKPASIFSRYWEGHQTYCDHDDNIMATHDKTMIIHSLFDPQTQ